MDASIFLTVYAFKGGIAIGIVVENKVPGNEGAILS